MENSKGQNKRNDQDLDQQKRKGGVREDVTRRNADHSNASPSRGGTTDMNNDDTLRSSRSGMTTGGHASSGITTKRNVTGSDYDGQVSEG
jgi:hypothetical protein